MTSHLQRFGRAYLVGGLFVLVQVVTSIGGEFGSMTAQEIDAQTRFQWFLHWCAVIASSGTVILAFLSKSAQGNPPTPSSSSISP